MDRMQVNFRLNKDLAEKLDCRRSALREEMGRIPSRSEIFRIALEKYLQEVQPTQDSK